MEQHLQPPTPPRGKPGKRPRYSLSALEWDNEHNVNDRLHTRGCDECSATLRRHQRAQEERVKERVGAARKLHSSKDANHRASCTYCRIIWEVHTHRKEKEARQEAIEVRYGIQESEPYDKIRIISALGDPILEEGTSHFSTAKVSDALSTTAYYRRKRIYRRARLAGLKPKAEPSKEEHRDPESDTATTLPTLPPATERHTTSNLPKFRSRRKRALSDPVQEDVKFTEAPLNLNIPTIPGQFTPGPLFIRDPEDGDNHTSPAMSLLGAFSDLAGKVIWTAASTIGLQFGYIPTNNAGQQIVPDEARQSPKRRRIDDTSTPALSIAQVVANSENEHMGFSSQLNENMAYTGERPIAKTYPSILARPRLSSSASNAAKRALHRYPPRTVMDSRRRVTETQGKDSSEPSTDDSSDHSSEQTMPGSWISEPSEQSSTQSSGLSEETTDSQNPTKQDPYLLNTRSPPRSDAFYTRSSTQVRGGWAKKLHFQRSSTELSDQTSSSTSTGSEQLKSTTAQNGAISTTSRSDPEPKFKTRVDFFEHDEDLLVPGLQKLGLSDLKSQELTSQREERQRRVKEARIAAEKAKEEARLRQEAEKWNAQLRGLGLRKPKRNWITDLSEEWEQRVAESMKKSNVTCSPPEAVTMTPRDFNRMIPDGQWLNDSCVQAALTELATAVNKSAGLVLKQDTPKCVALGTFFWTTLRDKGPENKERMMKRTWGMTPLNFLDIETIIMPINESSHWTFILIRPQRREVAYIDSFGGKGEQKVFKALGFIEVFLGPARWKSNEWNVLDDLHVPSQHNGYDCGMFVITNSIFIALGLDPNTYSEAELPLQRRRIAAVLLNGGFKGDFSLENL
ncbi:specific protease-like protein [Apiospora aurea]|uniref:Specific protease-like protein n=1 Tax=Apiospora aurea TaxID=335848 RepID=A0ABR1Q949_9PEZI